MTDKTEVLSERRPKKTHKGKKSSHWRSPLIWIGSVIGALVIATATAFGTGLGQKLFSETLGQHAPAKAKAPARVAASVRQHTAPTNHHVGTDLPVRVDSASYVQAVADGFSFAFPQELKPLQALAFNKLPVDWQAYQTRADQLGGAITADAAVQIVLRGNAASTAIITGIQVVRHCSAPLTGTLLDSPPAGSNLAIQVGFNLDDLFPVAEKYQDGGLTGSYFGSHTISLRKGETQALVVHAETRRHYCQFTFQLLIDTTDGHFTESVTNGGKPFAVTAFAHIAKYKALYAGGVISPSEGFVRVSAQALAHITGSP